MSKYNIDIHIVAISTNLSIEKAFVLSKHETDIVFPTLSIDNTNVSNIDKNIIEIMQKYLMTSELELIPQIISLNKTDLNKSSSKKNTLNIVYGFLIKEGIRNFDSYWIEINFADTKHPYSNLLFEVIQKIK
jgi:hypothetical protein